METQRESPYWKLQDNLRTKTLLVFLSFYPTQLYSEAVTSVCDKHSGDIKIIDERCSGSIETFGVSNVVQYDTRLAQAPGFFCVLAVDTWRLRLLFANDTEGNERYRGMLSMDSDGYELLLIPSDGRWRSSNWIHLMATNVIGHWPLAIDNSILYIVNSKA